MEEKDKEDATLRRNAEATDEFAEQRMHEEEVAVAVPAEERVLRMLNLLNNNADFLVRLAARYVADGLVLTMRGTAFESDVLREALARYSSAVAKAKFLAAQRNIRAAVFGSRRTIN